MKLLLLLSFIASTAFADEPIFKKGTCITNDPKTFYVYLKITDVDKKTQLYTTSLYMKDKTSYTLVTDKIVLTFQSQKNYKKIDCKN